MNRPYSSLRSGGRIYWDDGFSGSDYHLSDVAYGLARGPRFSGQMEGQRNYSIAQHSILVAELLRSHGPLVRLLACFHDSEEFMLGDLGTPIKSCLPEYKAFAVRFREWIFAREGLPSLADYPQVKWADEVAMVMEAQSLMPRDSHWDRMFTFGCIKDIWGTEVAADNWMCYVRGLRLELHRTP